MYHLKARFKYLLKDDETFIKERYKLVFGKELELESIKTFNEKIQQRILKDRKDIYTRLADKYLVRDYVKNKIGEEYLIKLLGIYEKAEDIDYDKLPDKFVLKCNHDSGSVIICKDKSSIDKKTINKKLNFFLKRNYYYIGREWHYKNIKPLIICEEFLEENNKSVNDYKIYVFNKKNRKSVCLIQIEQDRFGDHRRGIYTEKWELLPIKRTLEQPKNVQKPKNLELMIELSKKLTEDFDFVRVDFYECDDKVYFGELTFTPASGLGKFEPNEWDYKLGEMWEDTK